MPHHTTTYNSSGNQSLPSSIARLGKGFLLLLIMMMMGAGSVVNV